MPTESDVRLCFRVRLSWWVKPYLVLTEAGIRMGLPINPAVVTADLARGVRIVLDRRPAP